MMIRYRAWRNFIRPFGVKVELHFLFGLVQHSYDGRQMLESKPPSKHGFYEENSLETIAVQSLQDVWQAEIAFRRRTEHIATKGCRKALIEALPSATPHFDIEREKNVQR
jgi:hypothetical protein